MEANWTLPGPSHVSEVVRKPPLLPPRPLSHDQLGTFLTLRPHEAVYTGAVVRPNAAAPIMAATVTDGYGGRGKGGLRSPSNRRSWVPSKPLPRNIDDVTQTQ